MTGNVVMYPRSRSLASVERVGLNTEALWKEPRKVTVVVGNT